ncbi:hypothetical protein SCOR_05850 [Sulfidibacter corallicola]|uniref:Uncharacterized protein n=1 Tax=Sulfidibacter corallicola TaxID=2818388 RepID=A0A8A4TR95_SULCO|nr:hypothetical protein [Sulfidibacter corallicola]QTD51704.1 hypothetical protein J3U87_04470 [Sulfidibacter corallicola]
MSVKLHGLHRQNSTQQIQTGHTNPLGLKKSRARASSLPDVTKDGHVASTTPAKKVSMTKAKEANAKRVQILQLQVNIAKQPQLHNSKGAIDTKARAVFDAYTKIHLDNVSDNRPGTAKVYTLPEFFWSEYGTAFNQELHDYTLAKIQEYASNPIFEDAVFVLGTMVTAQRPESLKQLDETDVQFLGEQLGKDLSNAYQEATSTADEVYKKPSKARILLATAGDMFNDELRHAGLSPDSTPDEISKAGFDRKGAMQSVTQRLKTMNAHASAMKELHAIHDSKWPDDKQIATFNHLVAKGQFAEARALMKPLTMPYHSSKSADRALKDATLQKMAAFFKAAGSSVEANVLMQDFRKNFYPNLLNSQERTGIDSRIRTMDLKSMSTGKRAYRDFFRIRDSSSMFKSFDNKAIIVEGGKDGKMDFVSKVHPSDIDSPAYERVAYSSRSQFNTVANAAFRHESFQSSIIKAHPQNNLRDVKLKAQEAHVDGDSFLFEAPKTGLKLGVAICRDYSSKAYQQIANSSLKGRIDHLQVVSAGVDELVASKGRAKTSIALNDGLSQMPRSVGFQKQDPFKQKGGVTHVVNYDASTGEYDIQPNTKKATLDTAPIGFSRSFSMDVSPPFHLKGHDASSIGSYDDTTNATMNPLLEKTISSASNTMELLHDQLDTANYFEARVKAEKQKGMGADYTDILTDINNDPYLKAHNGNQDVTSEEEATALLNSFIPDVKKELKNAQKIYSDAVKFQERIAMDRLQHY